MSNWIPGYEGYYSITIEGQVISHHKYPPKPIKTHHDVCSGYNHVVLRRPGPVKKYTTLRIHRALALVFIGPCAEGYCVSHKDSNKLNNNIDNLEYVTYKENTRIAIEKGSHGRKCGNLSKEKREELIELKTEGVLNNLSIAKQVGCHPRSVQRIYREYLQGKEIE